MVPNLVVDTLFTDKSTHETLECAVFHHEAIECHCHAVGVHIKEVVACYYAYSSLVVAIVEGSRVVEVDVFESELLHVYLTAFTSFWLTSEHEHGVRALCLITAYSAVQLRILTNTA